MTGTTQFFDARTGFIFEGVDRVYTGNTAEILYDIHGEIFEQSSRSLMRVDYSFKDLAEATKYVNELSETFPLSVFTITERKNRLCRYRG